MEEKDYSFLFEKPSDLKSDGILVGSFALLVYPIVYGILLVALSVDFSPGDIDTWLGRSFPLSCVAMGVTLGTLMAIGSWIHRKYGESTAHRFHLRTFGFALMLSCLADGVLLLKYIRGFDMFLLIMAIPIAMNLLLMWVASDLLQGKDRRALWLLSAIVVEGLFFLFLMMSSGRLIEFIEVLFALDVMHPYFVMIPYVTTKFMFLIPFWGLFVGGFAAARLASDEKWAKAMASRK